MSRKKIILLAAALLVVATAIAGYVKREAIKHRVTEWRAHSLLADAAKAGDEGEWKEAERLIQAAWQLQPGDYDIMRQWFTVALNAGSRELLSLAHAVADHEEASPADRRQVLALFLEIGDRVNFTQLHNNLSEEEKSAPELIDLTARFALSSGQPGVALAMIQRLQELQDEPVDQLLLAYALAQTPSPEDEAGNNQRDAQVIINELFQPQKDHRRALEAFSLLRRIPTELWQLETFADAGERLDQIAKTTPVPPALFLLDAHGRMLAQPDQKDQIVDASIKRFIDTHPSALGIWLLEVGDVDRALSEIATPEKAMESPELFSLRVHGLIQQQDWTAAESLLANPHPKTNQATIFAYRAAIASLQGDDASSEQLWEQAFATAKDERGRDALLAIAQLAGSGNVDVRNRAVVEALKRPSAIPIPMTDVPFVLEHLVANDSFMEMFEVSVNLYQGDPDNPALLNNVAWLGMVGQRIEAWRFSRQLEEKVEKYPRMPGLRSTLVLALLVQDQVDKAATAAEPLIEKEEKLNGDLAVLGLLRARQGDKPGAGAFLEQINWSEMMTQERLYFRTTLKQAKVVENLPPALLF